MQTSHYSNDMMKNPTQHKSKKKLRFFSKSKKKNSSPSEYPISEQSQCYCEDCIRSYPQNNYMIPNQHFNQYYPREDQVLRSHSLPPIEQRYREESAYMSDQMDRVYPPPQQFPCECQNCIKKRGGNLTTELLPLDTQIPLQMMNDSALLCNIL